MVVREKFSVNVITYAVRNREKDVLCFIETKAKLMSKQNSYEN